MLNFIEPQKPRRVKPRLSRRSTSAMAPLVRLGYPLRHQRADDSLAERVKEIAVRQFLAVLPTAPDHDGTFLMLTTVKLNDETKPLMLVGNAHGRVEDGHVIAVANPDRDLVDEVFAGCAYSPSILKEIVSGRCDLCLDVWVDAYKTDGVVECTRYVAREARPATFVVR